jgi:hypothetical protein
MVLLGLSNGRSAEKRPLDGPSSRSSGPKIPSELVRARLQYKGVGERSFNQPKPDLHHIQSTALTPQNENLEEEGTGTAIAKNQLIHQIESTESRNIWVQEVPKAKSSKSRETV